MTELADELCFLTIREAAELLRDGKLCSAELTAAFLRRIERLDNSVNAFIKLVPDRAMQDARTADEEIKRGQYKGPMHGIPVALKDLYDMRGVPTTAGSMAMDDVAAEEHATATERLIAAGAVVLGKLATDEFALGRDARGGFPQPQNPWSRHHGIRGSSTGSAAAVASRFCMGALGTDTNGSIRVPASHCGVVGIIPSEGRVSHYGVLPLSPSLDRLGPIASNVWDATVMLQTISGHDPKDPTTRRIPSPDLISALTSGLDGLTVGVPRELLQQVQPRLDKETYRAFEIALEVIAATGATVRPVTLPDVGNLSRISRIIINHEAYEVHKERLRAREGLYGAKLRGKLQSGSKVSSEEYERAKTDLMEIRNVSAEVEGDADVLMLPTALAPAPRLFPEAIGRRALRLAVNPSATLHALTRRWSRGWARRQHVRSRVYRGNLTSMFNSLGWPAVSVPCGFNSNGLPIGLQIAGSSLGEGPMLKVAYMYEQRAGWFQRRPAM